MAKKIKKKKKATRKIKKKVKVVRKAPKRRYELPKLKQQQLVDNFLVHYNVLRASKESGYSYTRAIEIIKTPEMQEYIQKKKKEFEKEARELIKANSLLALQRTNDILAQKVLDKSADRVALKLGYQASGLIERSEAQKDTTKYGRENLRKWLASVKKRDKK